MIKSELVLRIAEQNPHLYQRDVENIVNAILDTTADALARGDVDAYVGAEPGPGVSLASGVGQLVEYPYGTEMGALNMVFGAHRDTLAEKPDLVRTMLDIHRKGTEYAAGNRDAMVAMAVMAVTVVVRGGQVHGDDERGSDGS